VIVDRNKFPKPQLLSETDFVYTQYNHLTTTGRPSNRYAGINYSALNKTDGTREAFISRWGEQGKLFMLDYDSYHPRLISKLIDVEMPAGSIHEYFGKMYFNKEELSQEEYDESKKITFQLIYGNIPDKYKHIEFFNKIDNFIETMWNQYENIGYVRSVISGLKLRADSKTKLFNYLIQNYETEMNMMTLVKILVESTKTLSKPILYTYDSILFDVHHTEEGNYIEKVKRIMELSGEFPVKVYSGNNYADMVKIGDLEYA